MSLERLEEVDEPDLVYFQPSSSTPVIPTVLPQPNCALRGPPVHCGQLTAPRFHPFLQNQANFQKTHPDFSLPWGSGGYYPQTNVGYAQSQKGGGDYFHSHQQQQYPHDGFQSQLSTENLIQEEVTRSAKTLFSKRNRTLLRWLNPGVSKGQLKIDVNGAWDSLPQSEKMFYISQVLGKLAPNTSNLMVNPHLDANGQAISYDACFENNSSESERPKEKKGRKKQKQETIHEKSKVLPSPLDSYENKSKSAVIEDEVKSKHSKEQDHTNGITSNNLITVDTSEKLTKLEQGQTVNSENLTNQQDKAKTKAKEKRQAKKLQVDPAEPRVKRKYVKRKLERKKYTRRKPLEPRKESKNKLPLEQESNEMVMEPIKNSSDNEDMDIWIDIDVDGGIELLSEEVDKFWNSIDDPNSLFSELEIE